MLLGTPCLNGRPGVRNCFFISLGQKHNFVVYCKGNRWISYCKGCAGVCACLSMRFQLKVKAIHLQALIRWSGKMMLLEEIPLPEKDQLTEEWYCGYIWLCVFGRRNYPTGICQERKTRTTVLKKWVNQTLASATGLFLEEVSRMLRK